MEKQSLSFHQLQAKYGKTPNQDKREDDFQKYEDFKQELQGTCDNIARFEDPPLRLRPQKLEPSPAKVGLNKYINAGKDNLADIICQAP